MTKNDLQTLEYSEDGLPFCQIIASSDNSFLLGQTYDGLPWVALGANFAALTGFFFMM